jgi:1-acyl-sn-glycerol-3-phosphate acyltransferase
MPHPSHPYLDLDDHSIYLRAPMRWFSTWCRFIGAWTLSLAVSAVVLTGAAVGIGRLVWLWGPQFWGRWTLRVLGIRTIVRGRHNLVGPALFISSHQSLLDVVVLPSLLPRHTLWVAKKELLRVPLWGWALGATGGLYIDRARSDEAIARIRAQVARLRNRYALAIFPEGTRSRDGSLGILKKGVFHIALQSRLPVVPIAIDGCDKLVSLGQWMPRCGEVRVAVGAPICTERWILEEQDQRMDELRRALLQCRDRAR